MDFDALHELIPKQSVKWTTDDIQKWIDFVGLSQYKQKFRDASVDGSCLAQLTQDDFRNQLGITSKIIIKKIMKWVNEGIANYDTYLTQKESMLKSKEMPYLTVYNEKFREKSPEKMPTYSMKHLEKSEKKIEPPPLEKRETEIREKLEKSGKSNELIIKQCDTGIPACHSINESTAIIGRHSRAEINVIDQAVSRFHAQIEYQDGNYYLRDYGSSSGTFLRITEKYQLYHGMLIEMGSNQFEVNQISVNNTFLKVSEGTNANQQFHFPNKCVSLNIGRKPSNQFSFPDDPHLSNIHAAIFKVQGVWYIQDLATTNGIWLRLSPQNVKSGRYPIYDKMQFKLGGNLTYECLLNDETAERNTKKDKNDRCIFCKVNDRDCIFLPCKHNLTCQKCAKLNELTRCTSCDSSIKDVMKIFKA